MLSPVADAKPSFALGTVSIEAEGWRKCMVPARGGQCAGSIRVHHDSTTVAYRCKRVGAAKPRGHRCIVV